MEATLILILKTICLVFIMWLLIKLLEVIYQYLKEIVAYRNIKGLPMLPIIGNIHQIKNNGVDFLKKTKEIAIMCKDEPIFIFWRGL